jgi:hypothetical protein
LLGRVSGRLAEQLSTARVVLTEAIRRVVKRSMLLNTAAARGLGGKGGG